METSKAEKEDLTIISGSEPCEYDIGGLSAKESSEEEVQKEDNVEEVIRNKEENKVKPSLGLREEVPGYLQTYTYILSGYRINYNSFSLLFWSLFQMHNETIYIWLHLFAIPLVASFGFYPMLLRGFLEALIDQQTNVLWSNLFTM
jgi:hypothetical protein